MFTNLINFLKLLFNNLNEIFKKISIDFSFLLIFSFSFLTQNPKYFTLELLDFLSSQAQYLYSLMTLAASGVKTETNQTRLANVEMALEALRNVIRNNPGMLL